MSFLRLRNLLLPPPRNLNVIFGYPPPPLRRLRNFWTAPYTVFRVKRVTFLPCPPPYFGLLVTRLKKPQNFTCMRSTSRMSRSISIKAEHHFIAESCGDVHRRIYQCAKSKTPLSPTFYVINKHAYFEVSTEIILKSILYPLT